VCKTEQTDSANAIHHDSEGRWIIAFKAVKFRRPQELNLSNSVKIDAKGRLRIPTNSISALGGCTEFFITSEDGKSAHVYPLKIWNEVERRLTSTAAHNGNTQKLLIRAKYFGQIVTMDKHGRVLIPVVLRETAHIKGDVDVLGYSKYLDVWNHTSLLKSMKRNSVTVRDGRTEQNI
jgi:MraZ protein